MQISSNESNSPGTSANDYVVVVLKIKSAELRHFYGGGHYLLQIWKNKHRLFQHVHDYDIKSIYLNKTELCYVLNIPPREPGESDGKRAYDSHLDFIFIVQPFT